MPVVGIESERVSAEYLEQMAYFLLQLTLNVTPQSIDHQSRVLLQYAAPASYGELRSVLAKPFLPLGISVASGASVGWALFPSDGNEMAPLLAVADKRMYAEKLAHRRAARARA